MILVIHPNDKTTNDFKAIYEGLDCKVIRTHKKSKILSYIQKYDTIIFIGHGSEDGLYNPSNYNEYLLDAKHVHLLEGKTVYTIWCYAKQFFRKHNLIGFSTDMFISDYEEAFMFGIINSVEQIKESNLLFSNTLNETFKKELGIEETYNYIQEKYVIDDIDSVEFNRNLMTWKNL